LTQFQPNAPGRGEITFRSNPTLRMMSSIRPRVFISTPSEAEFRQLRPPTLAAMLVPPTFPITATAMIRTQLKPHLTTCSNPIRVRSPVNAKNSGNSKKDGDRFEFFGQVSDKPWSLGITAPATKAPNSRCRPNASVESAETSATISTSASKLSIRRPAARRSVAAN